MSVFDRAFSLIAAICLAVWLVAVIPVSIGYVRKFGTFSFDDPEKTAVTLAAVVGFAIFWYLVAILAKLLASDWLAGLRQRQ
jgi:hypothetical protein